MAEAGRIIDAMGRLRVSQGPQAGQPVALAGFQKRFVEGAFADA